MSECMLCGCTDEDCSQCIKATGYPCSWVDEEKNLCSACKYKNDALNLMQNLSNATGAEFEDEELALKLILETLINT